MRGCRPLRSVTLSTGPRRNDPCPCGSGKRYKDCHGAPGGSQAPAAAQASGAQVLLQQAMEAYRGRYTARAAEYCLGVLAIEPNHVDALHLSGLIHMEHGDFTAAVPFLQKAAVLNASRADLHKTLARALFASGSLEGAAVSARRAVDLAPGGFVSRVASRTRRAPAGTKPSRWRRVNPRLTSGSATCCAGTAISVRRSMPIERHFRSNPAIQ